LLSGSLGDSGATNQPARYLDGLSKTRTSKHLVRRLEALGFRVAIEPTAA
jgi:hypothetical protein